MNLAATLFCAVSTLLSVQAITVSVDRADVRPVSLQPPADQQSLFANGWRPLTNGYDNIGVNVSPAAPLHPVLGKLQEHMQKPQRRKLPQQQPVEFAPPSILGSFALFAPGSSKQSSSGNEPKTLPTEREYSFLVPPPRDSLRFELDSHKKASLRDSEPYVRSSQFIPQAIKPDPRSPTYYIKPASYSTGVHPFAQQQARPFVNGYEQSQLLPHRQPAKQFEPLKSNNDKQTYFQNNKPEPPSQQQQQQQQFDRYHHQQQQQQQQQQVNGHYYNQINHPTHYKQPSFEREPSFLVHESHDVSYVTPSAYKFRPATYHYDNSATQEAYSSSTVPPRVSSQLTPSSARPDGFKQFKEAEKQQHGNPNAYYINDFQKTRLHTPADINEVLPKTNQPTKFNQQVSTTPTYAPEHSPKLVYVRPDLQQPYQSSIIPLNINQRPSEVEYATPEEISLKHFNQQQFALQQQLIQQDRQRLREVEKRRQQELLRQQQEELHKRQQEIKLLEQKQREKQQQKFQQTEQPLDIVKELLHRPVHHFGQQYVSPVEEHPKKPQEQYKVVHYQQQPPSSSEPPSSEPVRQITVQKFEELVTPAVEQHTTQEEFQPVIRPYRPLQKPFREPTRRRKPTTVVYETAPTDAPTPQHTYPYESQETLTELPVQTTPMPETTTTPPATERPVLRTRRPGAPLRRRRPSTTTTTTTEPNVSSQEYDEEVAKYHTPEIRDFEKKKRVRPVANSHPDSSAERRPLRKRPGQRIKYHNNKEHSDFDSTPERVRTTEQPFREITENYPAPFLKELYSSEYNVASSEKTGLIDNPREVSTESIPLEFLYSAETTVPSNLEYYEPTLHDDRQEQYTQTDEEIVSPEYVFTKTEVNYIETTTAPPTTTTPTTTTTTRTTTTSTEAPTSPKAIISSPKATHRMRPVRYGNATRPRFSIKDYKTRMEYKNRLAQSSSNEASTAVTAAAPKTRGYKNQQAPADPNFKEAPARYKYMSRTSYRTTSTTQPTQPEDTTTERSSSSSGSSSRFAPKKRVNSSHYYRSRITTAKPDQHQEHSAAHSTARPENVFSSAIRKRPTLKSRLQHNKVAAATESPEMQSAAETGFFATTTITSSSEGVNEIEEAVTPGPVVQDEKQLPDPSAVDLSDVTMDESDDNNKNPVEEAVEEHKLLEIQNGENIEEPSTTAQSETNENRPDESDNYPVRQQQPSPAESTTPFDLRHEEELFAKASQSVADLTSSASALYDKPGMFKAVSPAGENRVISAHLKIATDEPTLPIEAFFHEISRKN